MILAIYLALAPPHPVTFGSDLLDLRSAKPPGALANCVFGALRDGGSHAALSSRMGVYRVTDGASFQVVTNTARGEGTWFTIEKRPDGATMARYRPIVSACL